MCNNKILYFLSYFHTEPGDRPFGTKYVTYCQKNVIVQQVFAYDCSFINYAVIKRQRGVYD